MIITDFITTDKYYWHNYLPEYERLVFSNLRKDPNILEIGIDQGGSIEFLSRRFPSACIYGVDIIEKQPNWPTSPRIEYFCADQSKPQELWYLFFRVNTSLDLIIDDGSHTPHDQSLTLMKAFPHVREGGYYILEDIHTSYAQRGGVTNAFHVLLALQHLYASNIKLTAEISKSLTGDSYFGLTELEYLYTNIKEINLFKRTSLPLLCYRCKKSDYDYVKMMCKNCCTNLYQEADSMAFIIKKI